MDLPSEDEEHQVVSSHLDSELIFSEAQLAESLGDPHHHHHHEEEDEGSMILPDIEGHDVVVDESLMDTTDEGVLETIVEEEGVGGVAEEQMQEHAQGGGEPVEGEEEEQQQVQMEEEEPPCQCPTCQENSDENGVFKGLNPGLAKCLICYATVPAPEHVWRRPEPPPPEQTEEGEGESSSAQPDEGNKGVHDAETQKIATIAEQETQVVGEGGGVVHKKVGVKSEAKEHCEAEGVQDNLSSPKKKGDSLMLTEETAQQIREMLGEKSSQGEGVEGCEPSLNMDLLFHILNTSFDDLDQDIDLLLNNNFVPMCENCHNVAMEAFGIYREIQRLENSLGSLRETIKDQVSKSFDSNFCKRKREDEEVEGLLGQIDATRRAILGEDCPAIAKLLNYRKRGRKGRKPGRRKKTVSRSALYPQVTLEAGKKRGRPKRGEYDASGVKQEYASEPEYDDEFDADEEEEHEVIQTHSGRRVKKPNYKKWLLGDEEDDEVEKVDKEVAAETAEGDAPMSPKSEPDWSPGHSDEEFQGAETETSSEDSDLGNSDEENEFDDDDDDYSDSPSRKRRRSSANRIPCPECSRTFADEEKKDRHFQRYHEPGGERHGKGALKVHSCEHCDKEFKRPNLLRRHLEKDHGITAENGDLDDKKKHVCEFCGQKYRNGSELRVHVRLHTGETPFKCDHCDQSFVSALKRETHIEQCHWDVPPLKCEFCDRAFFRQHRLRIHRITHTGERAYLCEICSQAFSHPTYLKYHQGQHAELNMESYKCKECGKQFANPTNLKLHVKTVHLKEFRFSCEVCGMGFTHMSHKRIHMRGHTGERPYKCEICGESFRYKDRLRIHLRGHTGERPFICDVCKKGFASRSKLKRHEKIHEKTMGRSSQEEEPQRPLRYNCDDCGKAFAEPQHLSAHKRYCQKKTQGEKDDRPKATKSAPGKVKAATAPAVVPVTIAVQPAAAGTTTVQKIQIEHIPAHAIQTQQAQMLVPVTYTYPVGGGVTGVAYAYDVTTTQQFQQQPQQQQQQQGSNVREYQNFN